MNNRFETHEGARDPHRDPGDAEFLGHPVGLYVCFFTELWERFSFYGMKALLLLYITKYHLFQDDHGYNLIGAYGGLVYAMPVIGGLLADRYLGMRKAVVLGGMLLVLGHLGMAFEGTKASISADGTVVRDGFALNVFYFSLALIVMGVGFLKPNISTIVGRLYRTNDPRTDSGFTIFYAGINIGAFVSSLLCAWLGERFGWKYGFGAAGIGMAFGLVVFLLGQKYLKGAAEPPDPKRLSEKVFAGLSREWLIYLGSVLGVVVVWGLLQFHSLFIGPEGWHLTPVLMAMHLVSLGLAIGIGYFIATQCNRVERDQMLVVVGLVFIGLLFFALYEQTYGSWLLFSDRVMNRNMWGLGTVTAGQLTALGAFFIFVLTPFFAWLWPALERKGLNPSKPVKSGLGMLFAGLAFMVLVWSARHPESNGLTGLWWFVLAYFILEVGEMLVSPIGLAAVTQLSVPRVVSLMMGAWFLGTSYSEVVAAALGKLSTVAEAPGEQVATDVALAAYDSLFLFSAKIGFVSGIVILVISPLIKRMMHGVK